MTTTMFQVSGTTAELTLLLMCTGGDDCPADPYHRNSCKPHLTSHHGKPKGAACLCGFPGVTEAGDCSWDSDDPAWARQHAVFHLLVFPGVRDDRRTVNNFRDEIVAKTERQRGCDRKDVYGVKTKDSTIRTRTVTCAKHGEIYNDERDTAVFTFTDEGRAPWITHVMDGQPPL